MVARWCGDGGGGRGVIKPRVHGGTRGGMVRAWWGWRWAGESSRCEDPAPTVGIAIQIAPKCRRLHARTMPPTYGNLWFLSRRGTPRRYVLREPELPDLNHFTRRKGKVPITNKGWNPYRPFATIPLLEYGGLNPILPFLEGRSDAACRVVIRPSPTYGNLWFLSRRGVPHCYLPPRRFPLMPMGRQ